MWLACAALTATVAVRACLLYNEFAGTDKSPQHIAAIAVGVLAGPLVGPFANSGTLGAPPGTILLTAGLLVVVGASLLPFAVGVDRVSPWLRALAWCGYGAACVAWFGAAIVSLGIFLS